MVMDGVCGTCQPPHHVKAFVYRGGGSEEGWQVSIRQYNGLYFYTVEHSWRGDAYEAFKKADTQVGGAL